MKLEQLNESIKQYEIDELVSRVRNNTMFYVENGLRGPSAFETGLCYEFALGLYNFLKSVGDKPELIFLVGNMKKAEAKWFETEDFDPSTEHAFHTIVKVRKHYYDINGRLGNKRDIVAMWSKFRRKKLVTTTPQEVKKYIKKNNIVKHLEIILTNNHEDFK